MTKLRLASGRSTPPVSSSVNPELPRRVMARRRAPTLHQDRSTDRGLVTEWSVAARRPIVARAQGSISTRARSAHPGQPVSARAVKRTPMSSPDERKSPGRKKSARAAEGESPSWVMVPIRSDAPPPALRSGETTSAATSAAPSSQPERRGDGGGAVGGSTGVTATDGDSGSRGGGGD